VVRVKFFGSCLRLIWAIHKVKPTVDSLDQRSAEPIVWSTKLAEDGADAIFMEWKAMKSSVSKSVICSHSFHCKHDECSHWRMHKQSQYCEDHYCVRHTDITVCCMHQPETEWDK
jgi:hypothetical protein